MRQPSRRLADARPLAKCGRKRGGTPTLLGTTRRSTTCQGTRWRSWGSGSTTSDFPFLEMFSWNRHSNDEHLGNGPSDSDIFFSVLNAVYSEPIAFGSSVKRHRICKRLVGGRLKRLRLQSPALFEAYARYVASAFHSVTHHYLAYPY